MAKVKVLIESYAKETKGGWLATSTTTLIKDGGKNILVDPGINRKLLLKKLKEEGLKTEDIDIVFLTHYHPDHTFLAAIFEKALILDGDTIYEDDKEIGYKEKIPGTNLRVIPTPGHAHEHCSLVVPTNEGKIVVAGDVFWWQDQGKQAVDSNKKDPFTKDRKALLESRKKLLKIADYIIPGHGKMFKNPKSNFQARLVKS